MTDEQQALCVAQAAAIEAFGPKFHERFLLYVDRNASMRLAVITLVDGWTFHVRVGGVPDLPVDRAGAIRGMVREFIAEAMQGGK